MRSFTEMGRPHDERDRGDNMRKYLTLRKKKGKGGNQATSREKERGNLFTSGAEKRRSGRYRAKPDMKTRRSGGQEGEHIKEKQIKKLYPRSLNQHFSLVGLAEEREKVP